MEFAEHPAYARQSKDLGCRLLETVSGGWNTQPCPLSHDVQETRSLREDDGQEQTVRQGTSRCKDKPICKGYSHERRQSGIPMAPEGQADARGHVLAMFSHGAQATRVALSDQYTSNGEGDTASPLLPVRQENTGRREHEQEESKNFLGKSWLDGDLE